MEKLLGPWFRVLFICLALSTMSGRSSAAETEIKKWFLGVAYSGAGVGYRFSPHWSTELRAQAIDEIFVGGFRENFHFRSRWGIIPYTGIELDYANFKGDVTEGQGFAASAFLGAEYYFGEAWSAVLDVGPAWIDLEDNETSLGVSGLEGVINLGFNFHFGHEVNR